MVFRFKFEAGLLLILAALLLLAGSDSFIRFISR